MNTFIQVSPFEDEPRKSLYLPDLTLALAGVYSMYTSTFVYDMKHNVS